MDDPSSLALSTCLFLGDWGASPRSFRHSLLGRPQNAQGSRAPPPAGELPGSPAGSTEPADEDAGPAAAAQLAELRAAAVIPSSSSLPLPSSPGSEDGRAEGARTTDAADTTDATSATGATNAANVADATAAATGAADAATTDSADAATTDSTDATGASAAAAATLLETSVVNLRWLRSYDRPGMLLFMEALAADLAGTQGSALLCAGRSGSPVVDAVLSQLRDELVVAAEGLAAEVVAVAVAVTADDGSACGDGCSGSAVGGADGTTDVLRSPAADWHRLARATLQALVALSVSRASLADLFTTARLLLAHTWPLLPDFPQLEVLANLESTAPIACPCGGRTCGVLSSHEIQPTHLPYVATDDTLFAASSTTRYGEAERVCACAHLCCVGVAVMFAKGKMIDWHMACL